MESVYTIQIPSRLADLSLQILNSKFPIPPHLEHVKRIWRCRKDASFVALRLLLAPVEFHLTRGDWLEIIQHELGHLQPHLDGTDIEVDIFQVPKRMPHTRGEFGRWKLRGYWPTAFHEHKTILRTKAEELILIEDIGRQVIPKLVKSDSGAIVVDPQNSSDAGRWVFSEPGSNLLEEPIMIAINKVAIRQQSLPLPPLPPPQTDTLVGPMPYLCTGYVAFCMDEPSVVSAMALVHSRIRAVVFINPSPDRGGLLSKVRLQEIKEINHHFSVYRCHLDKSAV